MDAREARFALTLVDALSVLIVDFESGSAVDLSDTNKVGVGPTCDGEVTWLDEHTTTAVKRAQTALTQGRGRGPRLSNQRYVPCVGACDHDGRRVDSPGDGR
jgi:hypothetical protein